MISQRKVHDDITVIIFEVFKVYHHIQKDMLSVTIVKDAFCFSDKVESQDIGLSVLFKLFFEGLLVLKVIPRIALLILFYGLRWRKNGSFDTGRLLTFAAEGKELTIFL